MSTIEVIQSHACRADPVLLPAHCPTLGYGRQQIQLLRGHLLSYDAREVEAALTSLLALVQDQRVVHDVFDTESTDVLARLGTELDGHSRQLALAIIASLFASPAHRAVIVAHTGVQGALRKAIHEDAPELRRIGCAAFSVVTSIDSVAKAVEAGFIADFVQCIEKHGDDAAVAVLDNLLALGGTPAATAALDAGAVPILMARLSDSGSGSAPAASLLAALACMRSLALSARGKSLCIEAGATKQVLRLCGHGDAAVRLAAVGCVMLLVIDNRGKDAVVESGFAPLIAMVKAVTGGGTTSATVADGARASAVAALRTLHTCVPHPKAKPELSAREGLKALELAASTGISSDTEISSLASKVLAAYRSPPGAA